MFLCPKPQRIHGFHWQRMGPVLPLHQPSSPWTPQRLPEEWLTGNDCRWIAFNSSDSYTEFFYLGYPLVICYIAIENGPVEIVDLPS